MSTKLRVFVPSGNPSTVVDRWICKPRAVRVLFKDGFVVKSDYSLSDILKGLAGHVMELGEHEFCGKCGVATGNGINICFKCDKKAAHQ